MSKDNLVAKIKPYIGEEVGTLWGPARVKDFVKNPSGEVTHVELVDFSGEDFVVELEEFFECLQ